MLVARNQPHADFARADGSNVKLAIVAPVDFHDIVRRRDLIMAAEPIAATVAIARIQAAVSADQAGRWQIEPFARPSGSSPVIAPNKASLFRNPVDGKRVHWEALHTFNPAAMVRNGKIYVLYRAEDDTGEMGIGLHTSRLGLAESGD